MSYLPWVLTAILYVPTFIQLYTLRWHTIDYTHAYFILPVSLWLIWRKRQQLVPVASAKPIIPILSLFLLALGLLLFLFGWRQGYLFISTFSLIPVLFALIIYFYGTHIAKELSFPILYLLLLVPPPLGILDSITLPMRYGVSIAADIILKLFDIPVVRDGLLLSLGGHEIYMGAPCSGLRSLITMFALGLVYVYLSPSSMKHKIILVLAIIPLALLGNLIRTVSTCLAVYYFGPTMAEGWFHLLSGIFIFIVMLSCLLGLEKHLEQKENDE